MLDLDLFGAPAFSLSVRNGEIRYTALNGRLAAMTGLRAADLIGRTPQEALPAEAAAEVSARYAECVAELKPITYEETLELPSGLRSYRTTLTPVYAPDRWAVDGIIGVSSDITDSKRLKHLADQASARTELALEIIEGGFWHYDLGADLFETSKILGRFTTGEYRSLGLTEYCEHVIPEDIGQADLSDLVKGLVDRRQAEYRLTTPAGVRWMRCKRRLLRDEKGAPHSIVGIAFDVTAEKAQEARLAKAAHTDPMTGLANRRAFDARAELIWQGARLSGVAFGVVLVDLDRFKEVNDRFGHAAGDEVLRDTAKLLRAQARPVDLVARIGGDEFALLLENVDTDSLTRVAERISRNLARAYRHRDVATTLSVSVGAALSAGDEADLAAVTEQADRALYRVKAAGRASWRIAA